MKCISTRVTFFFLLVFSFSLIGNSQVKYDFIGATLISGTALNVGAIYKFPNVKSGVDATVEVMAITGGISLSTIDGTGGFNQALQPTLTVPAYSNGYVELKISFLVAGTTTLSNQLEVPITPIDVDGQKYSGLPLYEFDEVEEINGYTYFQLAGSELTMTRSGSWARGKNNAAIDYPGIDTAQKQVMFTTVNANVTTMRVRVGADNQSGTSASRLRSLYFLKFNYPYNYVLAKEPVVNLIGTQKSNEIELRGSIKGNTSFDKVIIERSMDGVNFERIGQLPLLSNANGDYQFVYNDYSAIRITKYYRIRLTNTDQKNEQLSAIILLSSNSIAADELSMVNTIVSLANPSLSIQSKVNAAIDICIFNLEGRLVYAGQATTYTGFNSIRLPKAGLSNGYFVIVVSRNGKKYSQKIIVQ